MDGTLLSLPYFIFRGMQADTKNGKDLHLNLRTKNLRIRTNLFLGDSDAQLLHW
jgi:hypothetical protein